MKLQDLAEVQPVKQISKVFESYFGTKIPFNRLSGGQAQRLLSKVRNLVNEHRSRSGFYMSENDPSYLKLIMLEQVLEKKVEEDEEQLIVTSPQGQAKLKADQSNALNQNVKDPTLKGAIKKTMDGQSMSPDEQKAAGSALMQTIQKEHYRRYGRTLTESEIQQAQVVLAAQDMVDQVQKTIEQVTSIQFKDLPALVEQIKNEISIEQANQFNNDAGQAFSSLVQNLLQAKQQLESAVNVVTGKETTPLPGEDFGGDFAGGDIPPPENTPADGELGGEDDLDVDVDVDEPIKPPVGLGRKRR
jgi:hypothetical protein